MSEKKSSGQAAVEQADAVDCDWEAVAKANEEQAKKLYEYAKDLEGRFNHLVNDYNFQSRWLKDTTEEKLALKEENAALKAENERLKKALDEKEGE